MIGKEFRQMFLVTHQNDRKKSAHMYSMYIAHAKTALKHFRNYLLSSSVISQLTELKFLPNKVTLLLIALFFPYYLKYSVTQVNISAV
jgi:hypothetical protein